MDACKVITRVLGGCVSQWASEGERDLSSKSGEGSAAQDRRGRKGGA